MNNLSKEGQFRKIVNTENNSGKNYIILGWEEMAVNERCLNQIQNWNIFRQEALNILKSRCMSNGVANEMSIVLISIL